MTSTLEAFSSFKFAFEAILRNLCIYTNEKLYYTYTIHIPTETNVIKLETKCHFSFFVTLESLHRNNDH